MEIYVDNAATTKMCKAAINAMMPYLDELFGNPSSSHSVGRKAADALFEARERVAALLGCDPWEITFTSSGTESDNQAIISAARLGMLENKRHIISTKIEHHAVLNTLKKLEKQGFEVELLDVDSEGIPDPESAARAIRPDTCLVSVMYANNEIGTILPITEIGEVCRERGVVFHTDAVQAAGHLPINVRTQSIDMLSLSAHKFRGPKGAGALYCRKDISLERLIEGGEQESGRRAGTENIPAIVGMAAALEDACAKMSEISEKLIKLRDRLIEGLSDIPRSVLNGSRKNRLPANVSFCFEGIESEGLLLMLDSRGICAGSGAACANGSSEPSRVLSAIGRTPEEARGALRLSLSEENTEDEVEYILKAVAESVGYLRGKLK